MATKDKFKSDAFEAIHASALALRLVGAISDDEMREIEVNAFVEIEPAPQKIQASTKRERRLD